MQERLTPVEQPTGMMMRLMYYFIKKQFGKVLTPLKLVYSKLPFAFLSWNFKIQKLEKKITLDAELATLLRIRVAQLNTCTFCMDIGKVFAIKKFGNQRRFYELNGFESSPLYSNKEKAALYFATELTADHKIKDSTYSMAAQYFKERELIEIAWIVASEHVYNIMNIAFNIESDNLCQIKPAA